MSSQPRNTWTRSSKSWYQNRWAPPGPSEEGSGKYAGWSRREIRGAGSSGYDNSGQSHWSGTRESSITGAKPDHKEKEKETYVVPKVSIWNLQKILSYRKGSLASTYKKNNEANSKVYELNLKTMHSLDNLAGDYSAFEKAGSIFGCESEVGDSLYAEVDETAELLQQAQSRCTRYESVCKNCHESHHVEETFFLTSGRSQMARFRSIKLKHYKRSVSGSLLIEDRFSG